MFPKTREVVDVVFRQVLSNHVRGKMDASTEAKIHADVTGVLHILYGDFVDRVTIKHTLYISGIEVEFAADDPYIVFVDFDWLTNSSTKGFA